MRKIVYLLVLLFLVVASHEAALAKAKPARKKQQTQEQILPLQQLPVLKPIQADYDVYVGGLHLLDAHFLFQEEEALYHVTAHVNTHGIWGWMFPWQADLFSDGHIRGARFEPVIHKNTSAWKKDAKTVWMRFDEQNNVTPEFVPHEGPDKNRELVTPEQRRGSLDPLSGILQLLGDLAVNKTCAATEPLFDGKRRFDLNAVEKGWDYTDPQEYGLYKGKARRCDVYFKMIAGKWLDREHSLFWQYMDGDQGHEPFRIWLATLLPELPELAVRAESPSVWGRIVVHLTGWRYAEGRNFGT